jgi:hypothetical protein
VTTALTAAVPAARRIAAKTGSRLVSRAESSRASRVTVVKPLWAGTAAPFTTAAQPAIAVMIVVTEGILISHRLGVEKLKLEGKMEDVEKETK